MIAEDCAVYVSAGYADGGFAEAEYSRDDVERMAREVFTADEMTANPEHRGFFHGFAACLDVLASGQLSAVNPTSQAIRALVDVLNPNGMPGEITDVARIAKERTLP